MIDADFAKHYGSWAVITGGSEGVGAAFAERLAKRGLNLLLIARKPGPLAQVAADIQESFGVEVRTLSLDLTTADAATRIVGAVEGCEVGMLIHNAGADMSFNDFLDRSLDESERMVTLNVMTPMRLARYFAPAMVERRRGGIIMCSSIASVGGCPRNGVYSAAKSFINTFAEMLWYELGKHDVDVLATILGLTRTPAMDRLGVTFDGPMGGADPYDVADETLGYLGRGPIVHVSGLHDTAMRLRAMPRNEAVRALAAISESAQ